MADCTFQHRTPVYKACMLVLVLCTVLNAIGYCTPNWVDKEGGGNFGLWQFCGKLDNQGSMVCKAHNGNQPIDELLRVPQILITLELTALVVAVVVAAVVNCRQFVPSTRHRHLEIFLVFAGFLGVVATSVFWSNCTKRDQKNKNDHLHPSWSFFLVFLSSITVVVTSVVLGYKNDVNPDNDERSLEVLTSGNGRRRTAMAPI